MNIWFMMWVFVAVFILGASLWSFYILLKQRQCWKIFAEKANLEFLPTALLKSPMLRGAYKGLQLDIFSDTQLAGKDREKAIRTIFQFKLPAPMPTEGAIASAAFAPYLNGLALPVQTVDGVGEWDKGVIIRVDDGEAIKTYLTPERLKTLQAVMTIKGSPSMLIFSAEATILRIESTDPFDTPERLERFLSKVAEAAKILSL